MSSKDVFSHVCTCDLTLVLVWLNKKTWKQKGENEKIINFVMSLVSTCYTE